MTQGPHLAFGGKLVDRPPTEFRGRDGIQMVGRFPDCASARDGRTAEDQRWVDNAQMRSFITHPHRLGDAATPPSPTEDHGG
jgi:hypothetical protein